MPGLGNSRNFLVRKPALDLDFPRVRVHGPSGYTSMMSLPGNDAALSPKIMDAVERVWGFNALRPLQAESIASSLAGRDALTVLPTGGGKSLCYQVPPIVADRTDVVVSPLIALMKDQVDALRAVGYPAAALHSGLDPDERRHVNEGLRDGRFRLLFIAPERVLHPWFIDTAHRLGVRCFAIDEAHCISAWGHDFRPEYRRLAELRQRFTDASFQAFTATATPRVRQDIIHQLQLREPEVYIGTFDRPNLIYRVLPKVDADRQIIEVLRRHENEAAIVYCLSRKDTERTAAILRENGINAEHYHAGMETQARHHVQNMFAQEQLDVVCATVAFGMGIDRSNVRCVIHAAMPKSMEAYQQETGRAGRDGLEAECVLLYSAGDAIRWEQLIEKSASQSDMPPEDHTAFLQAQGELLGQMRAFASTGGCRHRTLSAYFGQDYEKPSCQACDVCLNEVNTVADSTVIARKILSAVARTEQRFGARHIVSVLRGGDTEMIRKWDHQSLSVHGLLKDIPAKKLTALVYQLVDLGLLERAADMPTLRLNAKGIAVMKGERQVTLIEPGQTRETAATAADELDFDEGLADQLRQLRKTLASERQTPAFTVFDDRTLRSLAAIRPTSRDALRRVHGIGEQRLAELGEILLQTIIHYCDENNLRTDHLDAAPIRRPSNAKQPSAAKAAAWKRFEQGATVEQVCEELNRAASTVHDDLLDYIKTHQPDDVSPWVNAQAIAEIQQTLSDPQLNTGRLKPLFDHFEGRYTYHELRIALAAACGEKPLANKNGLS